MKTFFLAAAACLFLTGPAIAMTDAECATMWKQADANSDGVLTAGESESYMAMMRTANKTLGSDAALNQAIFTENCKADIFKVAAIDAGAPLEGANSFTEIQAHDRAVATGIMVPDALVKDAKGIWRGSAIKDGKKVDVAVDYKGNVVTQ